MSCLNHVGFGSWSKEGVETRVSQAVATTCPRWGRTMVTCFNINEGTCVAALVAGWRTATGQF